MFTKTKQDKNQQNETFFHHHHHILKIKILNLKAIYKKKLISLCILYTKLHEKTNN